MKKEFILISLCLAGFLLSCSKEKTAVVEIKPVQLTEKQQQVVNQGNTFGFDFFRKVYELSGNNGNLMVSPLSVSMALGMTRNGAAGTTLAGMNTALGMAGMTDSEINEAYKYILETFSSLDPKVKLAIANSIWYRNTFSVQQSFINTNQDYFHAQVSPLDFSDPGAVSTINNWVSTNTNQLIPKILDQIPSDMVMYLIDAVYFKGQWKYRFDPSKTQDEPFYLPDGTVVQAPAMIMEKNISLFSGNGFAAIELPYNQGNYNMIVMLPDTGKTVNDVTGQLSQENWNSWYSQFAPLDVQLQLPRFKFSYDEPKMKEVLGDLGMAVAFDPVNADFTRINPDGNLFISEIKHKTYIETNEEGTEAAAVTSVGVAVNSVPVIHNFIVNRPFVFFINEKSTGVILFIGTVMNPLNE